MKKNKILTSVFTFALLITLTATLEVKAYSKTLTNDDYCYYKSGSQKNDGFMSELTYKSKQTSVYDAEVCFLSQILRRTASIMGG